MTESLYADIVPGTTTGSNAAAELNKVGSDSEISIKVIASMADVGDVNLYKDGSIIFVVDEQLYYSWDATGSAWVESTDFALVTESVTNGDAHNHSGGDGGQVDHTGLSNIGTNTHVQIDSHIGSTSNPHTVTAAQVGSYTTSQSDLAFAPIAKGVTNGDTHDHSGGDGAQVDHVNLANKGTNTHSQIDTHVGSTSNPHSVTASQVGSPSLVNPSVANNVVAFSNTAGAQKDSGIAYSSILKSGDILTGSQAKIGGVTDYTNLDATGFQTMVGDARPWRDEIVDALSLLQTGTGVSNDATENTVVFATNSNLADYIYGNVQLNHDRDLTANIYPHVHWFQAENHVPNFLLQYRWQTLGGAKVTAWTNLKCNSPEYTYTSGTLHQICHTASGIAVPVGTSKSDIVQLRVLRDNSNTSTLFTGADPYTLAVSVISVDIHIRLNQLGSATEL